LVPIEKKLLVRVNTSAAEAVAASSTIMPSSGTSAPTSAAASTSADLTRAISSRVLTMGTMTPSRVSRPLSSTARS
jgi:hypothetical protein